MNRMLSRLVPLLLPACMVDTPVVEGQDDRLGEDLAAWCESTCNRWRECGIDAEAPCPESCMAYFAATFTGHGEACSNAGLRTMDCLEQVSCAEHRTGDPCNLFAEEQRCLEPLGVECLAEDQAAGNSCSVGYSDCSDGKVYNLLCGGPEIPPRCDCLVDGVSTGSFALSVSGCPLGEDVKRICGWPIMEEGHPTSMVGCTLSGSTGVAGGAGVNECGISFGACSDQNQYAIDCSGPPGAVVCTCTVNATPLGSFESGAGICDLDDGPDSGRAMANYTCGFSLAPARSL